MKSVFHSQIFTYIINLLTKLLRFDSTTFKIFLHRLLVFSWTNLVYKLEFLYNLLNSYQSICTNPKEPSVRMLKAVVIMFTLIFVKACQYPFGFGEKIFFQNPMWIRFDLFKLFYKQTNKKFWLLLFLNPFFLFYHSSSLFLVSLCISLYLCLFYALDWFGAWKEFCKTPISKHLDFFYEIFSFRHSLDSF